VISVERSAALKNIGDVMNKEELIEKLESIRSYATLESASFGFSDDRVEIKSVFAGGDDRGRVGDVIHPTDYVKRITSLYRETWIISSLDEVISSLREQPQKATEMNTRELEFLEIVARQRDTMDKLIKRVERLESKSVMTEVIVVQ